MKTCQVAVKRARFQACESTFSVVGRTTLTHQSLDKLSYCRTSLIAARSFALDAQPELYGARLARARDLVGKICDDIAYVERLSFCVEGDVRSAGR